VRREKERRFSREEIKRAGFSYFHSDVIQQHHIMMSTSENLLISMGWVTNGRDAPRFVPILMDGKMLLIDVDGSAGRHIRVHDKVLASSERRNHAQFHGNGGFAHRRIWRHR
jgi:hypothetical protein